LIGTNADFALMPEAFGYCQQHLPLRFRGDEMEILRASLAFESLSGEIMRDCMVFSA
jgi:hypothetical protein